MTATPELEIRINPEYESLVPPMTKEAFDSLVSSIRDSGQHEPITVNGKGEVLDGHHRLKACQLLQLKADFEVKTFENPLLEQLYVIDINLQRRQLTDPQRVQLSLRKKPILEELAKLNESLGGKGVQICTPLGRVNDVIAKDSGVSARQVSKIETILEKAEDGLKNRVLAGKIAVDRAFKKVRGQEKRAKLVQEALNNNAVELPEGIQLVHGDFIEKSQDIPDESIDLIFTDPPYDKEHLYLYGELAKVAQRILKPGGSLVTYVGHYAIPEIVHLIEENSTDLKFYWQLILLHTGSTRAQHGPKVFVWYKPMFWYVKGDRSNAPDEYMNDVIRSESPDKIGHDWEQSPDEALHTIRNLTVEGQIVFDPMMGYATTGIAALKLNRKFIGMEIDEEHFKTAQLRIGKELANKDKEEA